MKKTIAIALTLSMSLSAIAFADTQPQVIFNGTPLKLELPIINKNDTNFYPFRELIEGIGGEVTWNEKTEVATGIYKGKLLILFTPGKFILSSEAQGKTINLMFTDNGSKYVPIRHAAEALGLDVKFEDNNVILTDIASLTSKSIEETNSYNTALNEEKLPENSYRIALPNEKYTDSFNTIYRSWNDTAKIPELISNDSGTVSLIYSTGELKGNDKLTVVDFDESYNISNKREIPMELPIFIGYYQGETYQYILFGQKNEEENNSKSVFEIVKYDKNFKKVDSLSVNGSDSFTINPGDTFSTSFSENSDGKEMTIHTSRVRYTTTDGLNHQSQFTMVINTENMTILNKLGEYQDNHASHSFNQFVKYDGDEHVLVDHGDAYPRSIFLQKSDSSSKNGYKQRHLFNIPGAIGDNDTGVNVGGFELSKSNYIVVINHNTKDFKSKERTISLLLTPRNTLDGVKEVMIENYIGTGIFATTPYMIKLNEEKLMLIWQEEKIDNEIYGIVSGDVKYVYIDDKGKMIGKIQTLENYNLSKCAPIYKDGKVIWVYNEDEFLTFYYIPVD